MIIDIVFIALLILSYMSGAKKGLVKSVRHFAGWIITVIIVWIFANAAAEYIAGTSIYEWLRGVIELKLSEANEAQTVMPKMWLLNGTNAAADTAAKSAVYIALLILVRLLVSLLFGVLDAVSKLPLVSFVNKIAGGALGVINYMIIVTVILAAIAIFCINIAALAIQGSSIVKYLYNNNILLQIFM